MEAAPTWAAGEASAEAANQLPAIGADGRDGGLPRAVLPRGNAGMMADVMPALPSRSSRLVQGRIARFVSDIAPGRVRLHSLRHNRGKEPAGFPRQPKFAQLQHSWHRVPNSARHPLSGTCTSACPLNGRRPPDTLPATLFT